MKHLVLGTGNLGIDLARELEHRGHGVHLFGRRHFEFDGCDGRTVMGIRDLAGLRADVVWNTIGAGGPGAARAPMMLSSHLMLPVYLAEWAPKLICFSTAYLNEDPEGRFSDYALSKFMMERAMEKRENVRCLRVGSLYGTHHPLKCLPGRVLKLFLSGDLKTGATNLITPTPTAWLAKEMVHHEIWSAFGSIAPGENLSPFGFTPVNKWIQEILRAYLGEEPAWLEPDLDQRYPYDSSSKVNMGPHWGELWSAYGPEVLLAARMSIAPAHSLSRCR